MKKALPYIDAFDEDFASVFDDETTINNAGVFLKNELERMDETINMPLSDYTWTRDIDLRRDISVTDEALAILRGEFFAVGGGDGTGKSWMADKATVIPEANFGVGKESQPVYLWGQAIGWTLFEILRAQRLGRRLDAGKLAALNEKYNRDANEMVYTGDTVKGVGGLCNNPKVTTITVDSTWGALIAADPDTAPDKILAQFNDIETKAWNSTNNTIAASRFLLPPENYALANGTRMKGGNGRSILTYIKENCLSMAINGRVDIWPCTALRQAGAGSKNRLVAYTKNPRFLRFPITALANLETQRNEFYFRTPYYAAMSSVEMIYPETVLYADGI